MAAPGATALVLALWALAASPLPPARPAPPDTMGGTEVGTEAPVSAPVGVGLPVGASQPDDTTPLDASHLAPATSAQPPGATAPRIAAEVAAQLLRATSVAAATSAERGAPTRGAEPGPVQSGPRSPLPPQRTLVGAARTAARNAASTDASKLVALPARLPVPARLPDTGYERQPDQFVCRDPRLAGAMLPAIGDFGAPCGITLPVRLTSISGVALDTPATLDCPTARRVAHWLTGVAEPLARQHFGSPIVEVDVMGSYACRTRNNRPGARLSEHGLGRAIDIGGFRLADGRRISVKEDWGGSGEGKFLKALHRQSCGLFMTVLGPGADRYHHDHFHLDTARRNGSTYCR